jgi:SPX domain protein involved in polyphosphate accumulation
MENFKRKSYKFLINKKYINDVKKILSDNLIIDRFSDNVPISQLVSSIYLDDNNFYSYHSRLNKDPDAVLIRLRYYNNNHNNLFLECKTHSGFTKDFSVKERIKLNPSDISEYFSSRNTINYKTNPLYDKINFYIINKNYSPKIKIIYNRISYKNNTDSSNNIRATLDENLYAFVVNDIKDIYNNIDNYETNKKVKINYGILEIKLNLHENYENIKFINDLIESKYIVEFPEFSKYISTVSYLYNNIISKKPYWYDHIINYNNNNNNNNHNNNNNNFKIYPFALKPNIFNSFQHIFYKIFSLTLSIPFIILKINKINNHKSIIINKYTFKYFIVFILLYNILDYHKNKYNLLNKQLSRIENYIPYLFTFLFILCLFI